MRRIAGDRRASGDFMEALLALAVVTIGIVVLTASLSFLALNTGPSDRPNDQASRYLEALLGDRVTFKDGTTAEMPDLIRCGWRSPPPEASGVLVAITGLEGDVTVLVSSGDVAGGDVSAASAPIAVRYAPDDVRPALLTVRVAA